MRLPIALSILVATLLCVFATAPIYTQVLDGSIEIDWRVVITQAISISVLFFLASLSAGFLGSKSTRFVAIMALFALSMTGHSYLQMQQRKQSIYDAQRQSLQDSYDKALADAKVQRDKLNARADELMQQSAARLVPRLETAAKDTYARAERVYREYIAQAQHIQVPPAKLVYVEYQDWILILTGVLFKLFLNAVIDGLGFLAGGFIGDLYRERKHRTRERLLKDAVYRQIVNRPDMRQKTRLEIDDVIENLEPTHVSDMCKKALEQLVT